MILQIDVRVAEQAAAARQQDHHDYGPLAPLFGLEESLVQPGDSTVRAEGRLVLVRHGEHRQQTLEGRKIPIVHGCRNRLLHQMVARDESRVPKSGLVKQYEPYIRKVVAEFCRRYPDIRRDDFLYGMERSA
jgi:hypothetical protein